MSRNPARPAPGAALARLEDLPEDFGVAADFSLGDALWSVILVRRGAGALAFENRCPHAAYPLERPDGRVILQAGRFLVCSAHGASFDAETGACVGGPGGARALTPVRVRIEDGAVILAD